MSSATRFDDCLGKTVGWVLAAAAAAALGSWYSAERLPTVTPASPSAGAAALVPQGGTGQGEHDWSVFQSGSGTGGSSVPGGGKDLRLAGTYFEYSEDGTTLRKAILDDLQSGQQNVLKEGDSLRGGTLLKVFRDHVVFRDGSGNDQSLWLVFSGQNRGAEGASQAPPETGDDKDLFRDADQFGGKRTGENRWMYRRETLLAYYKELRDNPERLVKVFDSLKPLYTESGKINGYRLDIEGEKEFFTSTGLKQGDIVRSVNSVSMTSRRRAEYFIKEFVADRANGFVFEIERDGAKIKSVYEIR